ncbi:MAG: GntR family transcriptional regulator [Stappiaceae bacterium]
MARKDDRYRIACNKLLDHCCSISIGSALPSEMDLAQRIGVSRTVIRASLKTLQDKGIIVWNGRMKQVLRKPLASDRLDEPHVFVSLDALEAAFLDWILRFDVPQGAVLNVTQLSREFGVAIHTLQEFLSGLSRFGIVERRSGGGWTLCGFTKEFAIELSDFRTVLELNAIQQFTKTAHDDPVWDALDELKARHLELLERIETDYHDFSKLDEQFHQTINSVVSNRFVAEFQKIISLIFHYHFQWNKFDERQRNEAAIREHLACIDALLSRNAVTAETAARTHLETSKRTLLNSLTNYHCS